jgi:uncharacterized protein YkwD
MKFRLVLLFMFPPMLTVCQVHSDSLDMALFKRINEFRYEQGLPGLVWSEDVHKAALHHSTYQARLGKQDCSHNEFKKIKGIKSLPKPSDRIKKFCGNVKFSGENAAYDEDISDLSNSIFELWLESTKGHREFMLDDRKDLYAACCIVVSDLGGYATFNIIEK